MNKHNRFKGPFRLVAMMTGLTAAQCASLFGPTAPAPATTVAGGTVPAPAPRSACTPLRVYFMRGDRLGVAGRQVPPTVAVARAALAELLAGPAKVDEAAGLWTAIPPDVRVLGLSTSKHIAIVDLGAAFVRAAAPASMTARLAQVVYTLTQFADISKVIFRLDGQPVKFPLGTGTILDQPFTRSSFEPITPAILVETPVPGQVVATPLHLSGTANVFEAVFQAELRGSTGHLLLHRQVHATSGSGTRGTFDLRAPYSRGMDKTGNLVVFDLSPKDGSRQDMVRVPVVLRGQQQKVAVPCE
jgi:hypothetical protein